MSSKKISKDEVITNRKNKFFEEIKAYIVKNYKPTYSVKQPGILFLTTDEVYEKIYFLFPSRLYNKEKIALWLNELGYRYIDLGNMNFEWMFKSKRYQKALYEKHKKQRARNKSGVNNN